MCVWENDGVFLSVNLPWGSKKINPAAAGCKSTLVYFAPPCCYRSLMLSDEGSNDWNTSSICHQLAKPTHDQFSDWITGAGRRYEKWSVSLGGPTPLSAGHPDEWLNRRKGAVANQHTISLFKWVLCKWSIMNASKQPYGSDARGDSGVRCMSVYVYRIHVGLTVHTTVEINWK